MSQSLIKPGVVTGEALNQLLRHANENNYALPEVNVVGTNSINAVLETAKTLKHPIIIHFSNGGDKFYTGKSPNNKGQKANIAGSISGALQIHQMAEYYNTPIVLHTDQCVKKLVPWVYKLLDASENSQPLPAFNFDGIGSYKAELEISNSVQSHKTITASGNSYKNNLMPEFCLDAIKFIDFKFNSPLQTEERDAIGEISLSINTFSNDSNFSIFCNGKKEEDYQNTSSEKHNRSKKREISRSKKTKNRYNIRQIGNWCISEVGCRYWGRINQEIMGTCGRRERSRSILQRFRCNIKKDIDKVVYKYSCSQKENEDKQKGKIKLLQYEGKYFENIKRNKNFEKDKTKFFSRESWHYQCVFIGN